MLGLHDQNLKHRDRIEQRMTAPANVVSTQTFSKPLSEILRDYRLLLRVKEGSITAQNLEVVIQTEKRLGSMTERLR